MYDLLVAGGGPAGSSTGRCAAQRGLKTLVVEKENFPRYKPCAGAVSNRALRSLDFMLPDEIMEKKIYGLRLCFRGRKIEARRDFPVAVTVTRSSFDEYLLGKASEAGALVHMGERVLELEEHYDHVRVRTDTSVYKARYAVIGEGAQGSLKKIMGGAGRDKVAALSMVAQVEAPNSEIDERLPELLEIHIDLLRMGYCWIFPHDGYYSVGLWGFTHHISDPKGMMNRFLERTGFSGNLKLRGHIMPAGQIRSSPATARMLAVGDAAGFIDPFTGEGISYAIISGRMAAEEVAGRVTGEWDREGYHGYAEKCRREFAGNFISARRMAQTVYRFPSFFFELLANDSDLFKMLLAAPEMKRLYLDYLLWMLPRLHRTFRYYLRGRVLRREG
ncbi:MAG: geranylgeranyl reductase family protein [Syntrophales bacterium]|nr:geranylgeranyl reductase family protein [Syntrophales bacterium]